VSDRVPPLANVMLPMLRPAMFCVLVTFVLNLTVALPSAVVGTPPCQLAALFQSPPAAGPIQVCAAGTSRASRFSRRSVVERGTAFLDRSDFGIQREIRENDMVDSRKSKRLSRCTMCLPRAHTR